MDLDFQIVFYKNDKGHRPIEKFLLGLVKTNKALFNKTSKGIDKLRRRIYHQEPLSKYLEPGLWELRVRAGNNILRIIYTFEKGLIIILLHVFIKKQQTSPAGELEIARGRLKEINERKIR